MIEEHQRDYYDWRSLSKGKSKSKSKKVTAKAAWEEDNVEGVNHIGCGFPCDWLWPMEYEWQ